MISEWALDQMLFRFKLKSGERGTPALELPIHRRPPLRIFSGEQKVLHLEQKFWHPRPSEEHVMNGLLKEIGMAPSESNQQKPLASEVP
jgi:hypothetical protein